VFAIQVEHNISIDNCIVTAFWHSTSRNEIRGYKIFVNGTNLSNDTIISGTSDNNEVVSTLFSVPGCFAHFISVSAVNECGEVGPESRPVALDPENRHRTNATSYNADPDSGNKRSPWPSKQVFLSYNYTDVIILYMSRFIYHRDCDDSDLHGGYIQTKKQTIQKQVILGYCCGIFFHTCDYGSVF
jgi:hypothetical protein